MTPRRKLILLSVWGALFTFGALCAGVFVHGVLRDHRVGEPVLEVDLGNHSHWLRTSFRVFGTGDYRLILSSVNHDPGLVGRPFDGRLQVQVADPSGRLVMDRLYGPATLEYRVPSNYGDRTLDLLSLSGWPLRPWELRARIFDGDDDFRMVHSELKLWKERYDPGMGGMINYVMIIPAGVLLLMALLVSLPLFRAGVRTPLVSTAGLLALAVLIVR